MLIGLDVPQCREPKEIINSQDGGPYATRVDLGWVINGPTGRKSKNWVNGPDFLWLPEDEWPEQPNLSFAGNDQDQDPEVKRAAVFMLTAQEASAELSATFQRFSCYRLSKFIARCIRCQVKFHGKRNTPVDLSNSLPKTDHLTVHEIENAEKEIMKYVQRQAFPEEVSALQDNSKLKKDSSLLKLDPVLVDDLLCVGGRLERAPLPIQAKHQIIIPKNSDIAKLLISEFHIKSCHSGREYTLALTRERFWIINGNSRVRSVLKDCFDCKRRQASPGTQKMADLPVDRVTSDEPPFTYVGIDCFGPFYVRQRRSLVKRYGIMFTCLTVRAIHIEISHSLETDSFLLALRRFIARRGQVKEIRTDNGTNFVGGEKELRKALDDWNQNQIHEELLQKNIKWCFNPPTGSHHGGAWERPIRTVRKILDALVKQQTLTDESLTTLMCEVQAIINGRPLTIVSSDPKDDDPLTPNLLLLLKSSSSLPPGVFDQRDVYSRKRWRQVQYIADMFWKRWVEEYLPLLQQRSKWKHAKRNFAVDDVILVVNDNSPRNSWLIGVITEVYPGRDGLVRRARVKTTRGVFERPITKLCLLEGNL
ncbi:hypothetical protein QZH41_000403 [Actinostola sp. cb2023]|nr:hypothetical protein QZH41_000403 [Actinostola sp. cb2023]